MPYSFNPFTGNLDYYKSGVNVADDNTWTGVQTFDQAPVFSSFTEGSVLFVGPGGEISENNANFFYNNTTGFLRVEAAAGVVVGDISGDARGANSVDLQSSHSTVTQVASGTYALCIGADNLADGDLVAGTSPGAGNSVAIGYNNIAQPATDGGCVAMGAANEVYRSNAVAFGNLNVVGETVSGAPTCCVGISNVSGGTGSSAIGVFNDAIILDASPGSSAIGNTNVANVGSASAIGRLNTASASSSSAIGNTCTASGSNTAALGFSCTASGSGSVAVGNNCNALGSNAIVVGRTSSATSSTGMVIGSGIFNYQPTTLAMGASFNGRAYLNATGLGIAVDNPQQRLHVGGDAIVGNPSSLGSELTTNGTFTGNATGWTLNTGWAYNSNNVIKNADGTGTLTQSITVVAGKLYQVTFAISSWTVGTVVASLGGVNGPAVLLSTATTSQTITQFFLATNTNTIAFTPSNTARFVIDTVTVKEVLGGTMRVVGGLGIGSGLSTVTGLQLQDAIDLTIGSTTGSKIGQSTSLIGFYGATPVALSTGWTTSNVTTDKVIDANSTTIDEVADVLCTLIEQLKTYGILAA